MFEKKGIILSSFVPHLFVFLISFYSFFGYLHPHELIHPFISLALLFVGLLKGLRLLHPINLLNFVFLMIVMTSGCVADIYMQKAVIFFGASCLIFFSFGNFGRWYNFLLFLFLLFGFVHVFFTLYDFFDPISFKEYVFQNLPNCVKMTTEILPGIQGITNQTALNAFYITLPIACLIVLIFTRSRFSFLVCIALLISFFALLLTAKRGFLLANFLSIFFLFFVTTVDLKKRLIQGFIFLIFIIPIFYFLWLEYFDLLPILARMGQGSDVRLKLYDQALQMIESNVLWGHGFRSYAYFYKIGVHNIYLQLWCDVGFLGLCAFLIFALLNMVYTIKYLRKFLFLGNKFLQRPIFLSFYFQIFFLIYGLLGNPIEDTFILNIYFLLSSIPFSIIREDAHKILIN